jgi:DNA-binding transcriptional MerR regulator
MTIRETARKSGVSFVTLLFYNVLETIIAWYARNAQIRSGIYDKTAADSASRI